MRPPGDDEGPQDLYAEIWMTYRRENIPPKPKKPTGVNDTSGWKNVRSTYVALTNKLDTLPEEKDLRKKAINYWKARLDEDYAEIDSGGEPCYD